MKLFLSTGLVAVLATLALSGTALAANDPANCTYHPEKCKQVATKVVKGTTEVKEATTAPTPAVATAGSAGLPFTGVDVTLLLAGGALFGLIGFGIRRSGIDKSS